MVDIFVYYKNMKFTDQFSLVLNSEEHAMLEEMAHFCSQFDFEEHNDPVLFDLLWDKILCAEHKIITEENS